MAEQDRRRAHKRHLTFHIGMAFTLIGIVAFAFGVVELVMGNSVTGFVSGVGGTVAITAGVVIALASSNGVDI